MPDVILWIAVVILSATSVGLLLSRDWRLSLILLSLLYFGMLFIMLNHWPLNMAVAKLVTGWMAVAALGMSQSGMPSYSHSETSWPEGRSFRLFIAALVILAVVSIAPNLLLWLPGIGLPASIGGLILIGVGLIQLGITVQSLRVTIGLLTIFAGFEILYSSIENSILVAALLSLTNLSLVLVGAYLINAENSSEEEA